MKKFILPLLAILACTPMFTSCEKDYITFDSMESYFLPDFTVPSDKWISNNDGTLTYTVNWDVIDRDVMEVGDVDVAIVTSENAIFPLPYVYRVDYGTDVLVEQIRYHYGYGYLTIVIENEQGADLTNEVMPAYTFRVTAHVPVRNSFEI